MAMRVLIVVVALAALIATSTAMSPEANASRVFAEHPQTEMDIFMQLMGRKPEVDNALPNWDDYLGSASHVLVEPLVPNEADPADFSDIPATWSPWEDHDESLSPAEHLLLSHASQRHGAVAYAQAFNEMFKGRSLPRDSLPLFMQYNLYKDIPIHPALNRWTGTLLVTVEEARDLPDSDVLGTPEFYASVRVVPDEGEVRELDRTSVVEDLSPQWKHTVAVRQVSGLPNVHLQVSVHEEDAFADDHIGVASVTWSSLDMFASMNTERMCKWYVLRHDDGTQLDVPDDAREQGHVPRVQVCHQNLLRKPVDTLLGLLTASFRSTLVPVYSGPDIFYFSPEAALFSLLDPLESLIKARDEVDPSMRLVTRASEFQRERIQNGFIRTGLLFHSLLNTNHRTFRGPDMAAPAPYMAAFGHSFDEGINEKTAFLAAQPFARFGDPGVLLADTPAGWVLVDTRSAVYRSALHAVVRVALEANAVLSFTCLEELNMGALRRFVDSVLQYSVVFATTPGTRNLLTAGVNQIGKTLMVANKEVLLRAWRATAGYFLQTVSRTGLGRALGVGVATQAATAAASGATTAAASWWSRGVSFAGRAASVMNKLNPYILGAQLLLTPSELGNGWEYSCPAFAQDMETMANGLMKMSEALQMEGTRSMCLMPRTSDDEPFHARLRVFDTPAARPDGCLSVCDEHCQQSIVYRTRMESDAGHSIYHVDGERGKASFVMPITQAEEARAALQLKDTIDQQLLSLLKVYTPGGGFFDGSELSEDQMSQRDAAVPGQEDEALAEEAEATHSLDHSTTLPTARSKPKH